MKAVRVTSNSRGACRSATSPKDIVRATKRGRESGLTLGGLLQTGMSAVVVTTPLTERFSTAPHPTIGADSDSTVSTLGDSTIATGRPYVAVAYSVLNLAVGTHVPRLMDSRPGT